MQSHILIFYIIGFLIIKLLLLLLSNKIKVKNEVISKIYNLLIDFSILINSCFIYSAGYIIINLFEYY